MNLDKVPQLITNTDLQSAYSKMLKMAQDINEPLFVLNESKPEAVFISYATWLAMVENANEGKKPRAPKTPKVKTK